MGFLIKLKLNFLKPVSQFILWTMMSDQKYLSLLLPNVVEERVKLVVGSFYVPKDDMSKPGGDDAHFISEEKQTIGIADGVGGWTKKGVNAGEYARELMMNSVIALTSEPQGAVDPKRVLTNAHSNTKLNGSSTACILTLNDNILLAANVGDSGFMVIRNGKNYYKSPVQQYSFNHPYQLGQSSGTDHPSSALDIVLELKQGDIIVAGTDGLFDNMHLQDIVQVVNNGRSQGSDPHSIACLIADYAVFNSLDRVSDTPYAQASRKSGRSHIGGKKDDITVVVAFVQPLPAL